MKNGFKIIDSDMHIMEPMDLWEKYMDSRFKDHAPRPVRVASRGDLNLLILDGKEPRAGSPTLANDVRMISGRRSNVRTDEIDFARKRGFDAKSQLEAMDIEGIDVAVLFPTACLHIMTMPDMDPLLAEAICRAYNNWLYDFCQENPRRLYGAALLPPHDVSLAIREAQRASKELGMVAAFLRATPLPGQTWFSIYWEALWAELEKLSMPVGFHECTNSGHYPHLERFGTNNRLLRHVCTHVTGQMVTMVDLILGGVLERFPKLKVGFLEAGVGFLPYWMERFDEKYLLRKSEMEPLKILPSEYIKDHRCYFTCEGEESALPLVIEQFGDECMMYASDYPHWDMEWPHSVSQVVRRKDISDVTKQKILADNAKAFYRFS